MKISIVDKKDVKISVENRTIKFEDVKLPFKMVDTLIVYKNSVLNSKDIVTMTSNGINIIFLNNYTNKSSIAHAVNTKNADLKERQYRSLEKRLFIAKYLLKNKIQRHVYQLKCNRIDDIDESSFVKQVEEAETVETLLGIEGNFAREYFKRFFSLIPSKYHKGKRSKRPPKDPANSLLSYFYFLMYNIITVRLISFGFEPSIGYLHTPFRSHNALSSDVMELFRDQINQFVVFVFKENIVSINDFYKKNGVYLTFEGKRKLHKPLKDLWNGLESKINSELSLLRGMLSGEDKNGEFL